MSSESETYGPIEKWPDLELEERVRQVKEACFDGEGPFDPDVGVALSTEVIESILPALSELDCLEVDKVLSAIIKTDPRWIKDLIHNLKDGAASGYDHPGAKALGSCAREIVPALLEGLADPDSEVRELCGWGLYHAELTLPAEDLFRYLVRVGPARWPSLIDRGVEPADLSFFIGSPNGRFEPFQSAPVFQPSGALVYLPAEPSENRFRELLSFLAVHGPESRTYGAFVQGSPNPKQDRYLYQMRLVQDWAMHRYFGPAKPEGEQYLQQPRSLVDALWTFIGHQQAIWGTGLGGAPRAPHGVLGGDGEYARETLAFGLMSETPGVYRIWSRAWLTEK